MADLHRGRAGLAFLTMEASFIFGGVFGGFLVLALAVQLWAASVA